LMDDNMVPKITDFGTSRLFGQQQSRIITENCEGTLGYMAPEYLRNGLITTKSDIFSLGVIIIELLTGYRNYPQNSEASLVHVRFIENVVEEWRNRVKKMQKCIPVEICSQQVKECIKIGLRCVETDPEKRPAASDIITTLNATKNEDKSSGVDKGPRVEERAGSSRFFNIVKMMVTPPALSSRRPASVLPYKTANVQ